MEDYLDGKYTVFRGFFCLIKERLSEEDNTYALIPYSGSYEELRAEYPTFTEYHYWRAVAQKKICKRCGKVYFKASETDGCPYCTNRLKRQGRTTKKADKTEKDEKTEIKSKNLVSNPVDNKRKTIDNSQNIVHVGRKPTDQDKKNLYSKAIPWIVIGSIIAVLLGIYAISVFVGYVTEGELVRGGSVENTLFHVFILCIFVAFGGGLVYKGIKILMDIPNMLVTQVDVSSIESEKHTFFYKGEYRIMVNGRKKTMYAPVAFGDVKAIRNTRKAMLYYVPDKSYMLGKCKKVLNENQKMAEATKAKAEKLMHMDDKQKAAALKKISKMAWRDVLVAIVVPIVAWMFTYVILSLGDDGAGNQAGKIMLSSFSAMMVFLNFFEPFVKNVAKLNQVKKLKKSYVYWVVIDVTQCTRSINIFERWYRYAHFLYEGKPHKEWMIIGRYPVNKVTCLVSAADTSKPYAYMYNWFRGILY